MDAQPPSTAVSVPQAPSERPLDQDAALQIARAVKRRPRRGRDYVIVGAIPLILAAIQLPSTSPGTINRLIGNGMVAIGLSFIALALMPHTLGRATRIAAGHFGLSRARIEALVHVVREVHREGASPTDEQLAARLFEVDRGRFL